MAAGGTSGWKMFGIIVIAIVVAAGIAALAFFLGRGCEEKEGAKTTTTTTTRPQPAGEPAPAGGAAEEPDGAAAPEAGETETTAPTEERYVVGEGEGVTPCIGGFRTVTRTTEWSDGSTDTVTITEPCP